MVVKNYYKILGLETSNVSLEEIKLAYRAAAKKYHPDLNVGDSLAEEKIKDINEAYRILSVPASKRKYDRVWNSKFGRGRKAFTGKANKGTILNMFLGTMDKKNSTQENMENKSPVRGENVETEIHVSIREAYYGLEKKISIKNVEGKSKIITVAIPAGILDGEKIRLIGQGKKGQNGGKNGDLFIKINIQNDNKFRLDGCDIYTDLLLTPWDAALGTRCTIQTIDDEASVYIPQGVQSGEKIKIPNKGYKQNDNKRGDLIAEIKIVVPKKLTKQEKTLFEKLKAISKFSPRAEKI